MACAASTEHVFDPKRAYRLNPDVALRPEPFGALVYDFGTRRLSFLKTLELVGVVRELEKHADASGALDAVGIADGERSQYLHALGSLLDTGTIRPRETAAEGSTT